MSQSLAQLYAHIVFSTKERFPFLSVMSVRNDMYAYLGGICNNLESPCIVVGGIADHVHILCMMSKKISAVDFIAEVKRSSSKWIKTKYPRMEKFAWQNGYGVFSVCHTHVENVRMYIVGQAEHHRTRTFQDELREFLKEYHINYDERYVWD